VKIREFFRAHFGSALAPTPDDVKGRLWNDDVDATTYATDQDERYRSAIMEQYKLYVEMADRISARRALSNTFFLTLNVGAFTVIGVFWKDRPAASAGWLLLPYVVLIGICFAWFWLIRSYRQLNTGKYAVIGALERRLPASPYWAAEWFALGEGKDRAKYWALTHLEKWVPLLFGLTYTVALLAAILA